MPELPEVETTKRGIERLLKNKTVENTIVRQYKFRQPIARNIGNILKSQTLKTVSRRAKYLLFNFTEGTLIIHLGMSGSLRVVSPNTPPEKHDHVELLFNGNLCLRFRDPRRFGLVIWTKKDPLKHKLIINCGPEPLTRQFSASYLKRVAENRTCAIKQFIMLNNIVVGVGNIYASEALFSAGINPSRPANSIKLDEFARLSKSIKTVLRKAISAGGTTLKDFKNERGDAGYFKQELAVYGRAKLPCYNCRQAIAQVRIGQRSSFYCQNCQK
jgi:formamidopyrimidine-DNA glycosylase